jgi:hypothetical protein
MIYTIWPTRLDFKGIEISELADHIIKSRSTLRARVMIVHWLFQVFLITISSRFGR